MFCFYAGMLYEQHSDRLNDSC